MKVICPGSFDPVTYGHIDIFKRAAKMFDEVVIAVMVKDYKENLFSIEERLYLTGEACKDIKNVSVISFDGWLVDLFKRENAVAVVKGVRDSNDFKYEINMHKINKQKLKQFETILLQADEKFIKLSSTTLKSAAKKGKNLENMAPNCVIKAMKGEIL